MNLKFYFSLLSVFLLAGCLPTPLPTPETETNPERLKEILNQWSPELVDHFPRETPPSDQAPQFSAFPGFLQGGAWIQLRIKLPPEDVQKIFDDATKVAKQHHDGGDNFTLVNSKNPDGLASTRFHTNSSGEKFFPSDYRVFIYFSEPYKRGTDFDWNHGESKGVAVSIERNEVIYWAERW